MQISTDRLVSLSAMFIGVATLFIVVYQTQLQRAAQTASVLPYLMIALQSNSESTYIVLRNTGVGPALIEDVSIRYQGREYEKDPYDFYLEVRPEAARESLSVDKLIPGRLVSAGEAIRAFGTEGESAPAMLPRMLSLFDIGEVPQNWYDAVGVPRSGSDKAIIEVTYKSVYGDRWRVTSDRLVPDEL
jgi:hypothetical protein